MNLCSYNIPKGGWRYFTLVLLGSIWLHFTLLYSATCMVLPGSIWLFSILCYLVLPGSIWLYFTLLYSATCRFYLTLFHSALLFYLVLPVSTWLYFTLLITLSMNLYLLLLDFSYLTSSYSICESVPGSTGLYLTALFFTLAVLVLHSIISLQGSLWICPTLL